MQYKKYGIKIYNEWKKVMYQILQDKILQKIKKMLKIKIVRRWFFNLRLNMVIEELNFISLGKLFLMVTVWYKKLCWPVAVL